LGKKSREKKERRIARANHFHMTIGAAAVQYDSARGSDIRAFSLDHELRLVKAGLLYADSVTLCSFASTTLTHAVGLNYLSPSQKLELLLNLLPLMPQQNFDDETRDNLRQFAEMFANSDTLSMEDALKLCVVELSIEQSWSQAMAGWEQSLIPTGVGEIDKALRSGHLDLHVLGQKPMTRPPIVKIDDLSRRKTNNDELIAEFVDFMAHAVAEGKTFPLFDDMTSGFIQASIQEDRLKVSESNVARGKHSVLAAAVLERLPLFDAATVDEVLDVRRELESSLVRFRQAVIGYSDTMKQAGGERGFAAEADQLFHKNVGLSSNGLAVAEAV
jgi:hypothetical protein